MACVCVDQESTITFMKVDGQRTTHLSSFSWFFSPLINTSSKHRRWPPPQSWPSSCLIYFSITDRAWHKLLQVMNINICCSNLVIWLTRAARHLSRDISRESCRSTRRYDEHLMISGKRSKHRLTAEWYLETRANSLHCKKAIENLGQS
jgi:hypothetical protein